MHVCGIANVTHVSVLISDILSWDLSHSFKGSADYVKNESRPSNLVKVQYRAKCVVGFVTFILHVPAHLTDFHKTIQWILFFP